MSARRQALAIRHVPFEDLGSFAPVLTERGYDIAYVDAGCEAFSALPRAELVIILGGPISVNDEGRYPWLVEELALVERCLNQDIAVLGVCLGAQLIARALGARVYPARAREIGLAPINVTQAGMSSPMSALAGGPVLHWHGETFDLPNGASRLASTDICENQAFSCGSRLLAVQFHPEACDGRFERWLIGHHCELESAGVDINVLRDAERRERETLRSRGDAFLKGWLDGVE